MEHIKRINIENYKSIHFLELDCNRINLFIGEPNSGKSNILEALNLLYLPSLLNDNAQYLRYGKSGININEFFRVDKVDNFFRLGDLQQDINIECKSEKSVESIRLKFNTVNDENSFELINQSRNTTKITNDFEVLAGSTLGATSVKPFRYKEEIDWHDSGNFIDALMPPFGNNLYSVIKSNQELQSTIQELTSDYGLEFNIDANNSQMSIQIRINKGLVYTLPYKSLADTFKRFIFHLAAIKYSRAQSITLDEPDANSFPRYISLLGDEMIENKTKQYFVTTHNPYLANNLLENTEPDDLAVFLCYYDKHSFSSKVKRLTVDEIKDSVGFGVDLFFNLNGFIDDQLSYSS